MTSHGGCYNLRMILTLLAAALAADPRACTLFSGGGPMAPTPPFARAASVSVQGCYLEALHGGVATDDVRDRIWGAYVGWLTEVGFVPARAEHAEPWNHVRWQRFQHDGADVELQIRRPDHSEAWLVMLIPKKPGSPW
jgi:hypothetical protein